MAAADVSAALKGLDNIAPFFADFFRRGYAAAGAATLLLYAAAALAYARLPTARRAAG